MAKVEKMLYKGFLIVLVDCEGTPQENIDMLLDAEKLITKMKEKSVRLLTDVSMTTPFNIKSATAAKNFSNTISPYIYASAMVGVHGVQEILYKAMIKLTGRDIKLYDTREEALEYLIKA